VLLPPNRRARLASAPLLGFVLDDRYVLVDRIGGGGMSVVYAALQRPLNRLVAVKVLHAQLTATRSARERFEREGRTVSLLKCRNTVTLFDFGVSKGTAMPSVAYMVMEYVAGESLANRLKRVGALPPADVARIVRDVGRSLHEAHQKGIVHRDMKPANVILTTLGDDEDDAGAAREVAKVIDFGIARLEDTAMTQTGILLGTPSYMAPELFEGNREVDARADVYALGVMAFQMLSGQKPFKEEGGPLGVLWHHANSPVPPLPGADLDPRLRALGSVIRKAMAKQPDDRYGSIRALVEAFLAAMGAGAAALGDADVIELSIDDIEINPEVRSLTSQYRLDLLDPDGALGPTSNLAADTAPTGAERAERATTRRPGAALEERATVPRRSAIEEPARSRALLVPQATRSEPSPPLEPDWSSAPPRVTAPPEPDRLPAREPDWSSAPPRVLPPLEPERPVRESVRAPLRGTARAAEPRPASAPAQPAFGARVPEPAEPAGIGPTPPGRAEPRLAARLDGPVMDRGPDARGLGRADAFDDAAAPGPTHRKSPGFRGLVVVVLLLLAAGAIAMVLLDQQDEARPGVAPPSTPRPKVNLREVLAEEDPDAAPPSLVERVPAERVPAERVPAERVPAERVPAEHVPAERVPTDVPIAAESVGVETVPPEPVDIAPETDRPRPEPHRPEGPRTPGVKPEGRVEVRAAAVRAAIDGGECTQARRLFRELDELPGSTAAVATLSPLVAACRAGAVAPDPTAPVKVVVAPDAEDRPPASAAPPRAPAGTLKPARLVAGTPRVQGGLAAGDVKDALKRMLGSAPLGCVGQHNLQVAGPAELNVALRVTAAGQLIDASVARSTVGNPPFERCVVNSLRALTFPASADASRIDLPLRVVPVE